MLRHLTHATAVLALGAMPLFAQDLAVPQGDVILTVSGQIESTNIDGTAQFDLQMLQDLDGTEFQTSTIWTEGTHIFQGVSLKVLVERLGITGESLLATAINDYAVDIPLTDAVEGGPMVAYKIDGETMSVRDKGPLWLVYPYDDKADYRSEVIYSRSIWQLDRIEAVD
jgi:hypothetical protein|tara:strand:- start:1779 stop:2285 length:507 start_codon:yes stop_codon:yes gene_type:complete